MIVQFKLSVTLFLLSGLIACTNPKQSVSDNGISFISTNMDTLGKLINITIYKPSKVIYRYTLHDNSAKSRIDFSAPSDAYLEALLFYDTLPIIDQFSYEVDKSEFDFNWLPIEYQEKIVQDKITVYADSIYSHGPQSKYYIRKDAILLKVAWD